MWWTRRGRSFDILDIASSEHRSERLSKYTCPQPSGSDVMKFSSCDIFSRKFRVSLKLETLEIHPVWDGSRYFHPDVQWIIKTRNFHFDCAKRQAVVCDRCCVWIFHIFLIAVWASHKWHINYPDIILDVTLAFMWLGVVFCTCSTFPIFSFFICVLLDERERKKC